MKKILFLLSICIAIISFKEISTKDSCKFTPKKIGANLILNQYDSLQGVWVSTTDPLNRIKIINRTYIEDYLDEDSISNRKNYTLYFSDTLVDIYNNNYYQLQLDYNNLTGSFFVLKSVSTDDFWCYKFNGFSFDSTLNKQTLSISDTWAKYKAITYFKQ